MPATISSKITPIEPCISSALLTGYILYISKNLKAENAIKTSNRLNSKRKRSGIDCPISSSITTSEGSSIFASIK